MSGLTCEMLDRAYQEVKAQFGDVPRAFVVTPLFNGVDGYWQVPYQGVTYILLGRIAWLRLLSDIPLTREVKTFGPPEGFGTLYGIPVLEDEDLARNLIMTALRMAKLTTL